MNPLCRPLSNLCRLRLRSIVSCRCESSSQEDLCADLKRRLDDLTIQAAGQVRSSYKHRQLSSYIRNLKQTLVVMEKKRHAAQATAVDLLPPAFVSLEIISNGTTHMHPLVALRTPNEVYLFNCPEGSSRFINSLRMRPNSVNDFFVTRATWDNTGGLAGLILAKEVGDIPVRIHGPQKMKQFLDLVRPALDSDFGSNQYPVAIEERVYTEATYEDYAIKVRYLPIFDLNPTSKTDDTSLQVDVAYLIELKPPAPKIDILRVKACGVPPGPLVGKLKAGVEVTLPDGKVVRPQDVYADTGTLSEKSTLLVVECASEGKLASIRNNTALQDFVSGAKQLHYAVHLTPNEIVESQPYKEFIKGFGESCTHVVANGLGTVAPHMETIYRHQNLLNYLYPDAFPDVYPFKFSGVVAQDQEPQWQRPGVALASPLQRFAMRSTRQKGDSTVVDLRVPEYLQRLDANPQLQTELDRFRAAVGESQGSPLEKYPSISFLGTASALPLNYRNVSSYYMRLNPQCSLFVDCGESTYGQLRVLVGADAVDEELTKVRAVFITHGHQDHFYGLFSIIIRRREAFEKLGIDYRPLVVVCGAHIFKVILLYTKMFQDIEHLIHVVNTHTLARPLSTQPGMQANPVREFAPSFDITPHLPKELYDADAWGLQKVEGVQVHHVKGALAFIFYDNTGRKIVFSGDTKPCDLLVDRGKDADILMHEATFGDWQEADAYRKRHSTMAQAFDIGKRMCAKNVILTHFSARFPKVPALPDYLLEAGNVSVAMDNMVVTMDNVRHLPKLLPVYRACYQTELLEIETRRMQRNIREEQLRNGEGTASNDRGLQNKRQKTQ